MNNAYICDYIRTPIGRYSGSLSSVRADDLAALPLKALKERNHNVDWKCLDDVILGCANQSGEDNRNIARMSLLLAGFDKEVPGATVNRLCASGMDALSIAARSIKSEESSLVIAGGVESMSRAPFVMAKPEVAFSRNMELFDTTMGWRFVNSKMQATYGACSMPETAENLAREYSISRTEQDKFAFSSQRKYADAKQRGFFDSEILPVTIRRKRQSELLIDSDEHPRLSSLDALENLKPIVHSNGTVSAGNASGINDGAAALLLASKSALEEHNLTPRARIIATASAGVDPNIMGIGPVPAVEKVLKLTGLTLDQMDVIEINEAFSSQVLSVIKGLGLENEDPRINPNGGAIALGHPLGMSGARIVGTAVNQLEQSQGRYALCSLCVGVGQGMAMLIERV